LRLRVRDLGGGARFPRRVLPAIGVRQTFAGGDGGALGVGERRGLAILRRGSLGDPRGELVAAAAQPFGQGDRVGEFARAATLRAFVFGSRLRRFLRVAVPAGGRAGGGRCCRPR